MSQFSDAAKSVIAGVAPILGTALGGPFGALAGGFIAKALGGDGKPATPSDIEKALGLQDPATMLALKQADLDFQKHIADIGLTEDQLAASDADSARKREEIVKDSTPSVLAYLLTAGVIAMVYCLFRLDIPTDNKAVMFSVAGAVVSTWTMAMGYYFGSSAAAVQRNAGVLSALTSTIGAKK
jgi:hypothetical protein